MAQMLQQPQQDQASPIRGRRRSRPIHRSCSSRCPPPHDLQQPSYAIDPQQDTSSSSSRRRRGSTSTSTICRCSQRRSRLRWRAGAARRRPTTFTRTRRSAASRCSATTSGWDTRIAAPAYNPAAVRAGATRLESEISPNEYKLPGNKLWIVALAAGVVVLVGIALALWRFVL